MSWLLDCLEGQLAQGGERLAIDSGKDGTISYARLRALTGAIARELPDEGPVAILANRSAEAYAAVIACFRAGVPYVPINPSFPAARLRKVIELSGSVECLFDVRYASLADELGCRARPILLDGEDADFSPAAPSESAIAYQLFTSGSTGEPKGVPIHQGALSHYVERIIETVGIRSGRRSRQFFDLRFDLSMHDIFVTLATSGTIVPAADLDLMMPHRYVARHRIDLWFSVPLLAVAAARGQSAKPEVPRLEKALFCGEALPGEYARSMRDLLRPDGEVWNLYGPTEATIAFTAHRVEEEDQPSGTVPLGHPFGENEIAVLSQDRISPAVDGVEGELLLGGPQVFRGYEPATSETPFVGDDDRGRFYRTGDLVRITRSGPRYIGRIDHQVKIRGHRVELGEIETACRRVDGVEAAAALLSGDSTSPRLIVAYQSETQVDFEGLSTALPHYMLPEAFHRFDELPRNSNGKIDRRQIRQMLC